MITVLSCACLLAAVILLVARDRSRSRGYEHMNDRMWTLENEFRHMQSAAKKAETELRRLNENFTIPHPDTLPDLPSATEPGKRRKRR